MLFNSKAFLVFLTVLLLLYWLIPNKKPKPQNILLLLGSYYFYSCWDPRFTIILLGSTILNYWGGISIARTRQSKLFWLWSCITLNIGLLCIFKYNDFFIPSFATFIERLGLSINIATLKVFIPIGISFYTFHGLSYIIDVYKNKIKSEKSFINYALFVGFFPLLVAGPIERATHLLPQLKLKRVFNATQATDGLRQILWGLFKKVVIADSCAQYADMIFDHSTDYSGSTLLLGAVLFAFQIYGDFSGYSDIAIGTAKLFGISLLKNFSFPYFSRDIAEFWRRWHISLTSWFRDYVYIPLGGSRVGTWKKIRNILLVFSISGIWHGSNWTFLAWGVINGLLFLPLLLTNKNRNHIEIVAKGKLFPSLYELSQILLTFGLTLVCWVFFRASSIEHAISYLSNIFTASFFTIPAINPIPVYGLLLSFILIEWLGREGNYAIEKLGLSWAKPARYSFYYMLIFAILWFSGTDQPFIYFQF